MRTSTKGCLLRVFVGANDRWQHGLLYEAIVRKAQDLGLAGATVLQGLMGYGVHSKVHTAKVLRLSEDLPVVVELVDTRENIEKLLPHLDEMVTEGFVTLESVEAVQYRKGVAES